jgi:hypothetical protein
VLKTGPLILLESPNTAIHRHTILNPWGSSF